MKMSKHVAVQITYCRDIFFYDINCAFVGYNKNKKYLDCKLDM